MVLRSALLTPVPADLVEVRLPAGGSLVVNAQMSDRLSFLQRLVEEHMVLCARDDPALRVRHVRRSLDRTAAVITCDSPGADPTPLSQALLLPDAIASSVYGKLKPWQSEAGCQVYRIRASDD
jgi:hypothetical protein